jgi:Cu2+-exporting ATPase
MVGDRVRIAAGATLPCDGTVVHGLSCVDERLLTGEAAPCCKQAGDPVVGGSINIESPLEIEITALGEHTVLARIGTLAREALARKPALLSQAQAAAAVFIWVVLGLATLTAGYHGWWRGEPWLAPTLVVLVIACPCALALAVPTAVSMAMASLLARGVLVLQPDALARFARVRRVVFDKTGTLTTGQLRLQAVAGLAPGWEPAPVLALASALEAGSAHPIASALQAAASGPLPVIVDRVQTTGYGISGICAGKCYQLGSAAYLARRGLLPSALDEAPPPALKVAYLASDTQVLARFMFVDEPRPDAAATVGYFAAQRLQPIILSGDHRAAVAALAGTLAIAEARAECDPAAKLAYLESYMRDGTGVAAVGDGINDTPILARADVGITLGAASAYAKLNADIVLLRPGLAGLVSAHRMARRLDRIATQNLRWALAYNGIALPLALAGVVAPWLAALLMAASSLVVVLNAGRLYRSSP